MTSTTANKTSKLILRDMTEEDWFKGVQIAKSFEKDYPDRVGFNNLVIYGYSFAVYRTKTSIVVRKV